MLENYEDERIPDYISILPPENSTADVTDEDSGDENQVSLSNLPGSQLRVAAEIYRSDTESSDGDDDDDDQIPIAQLANRRRRVTRDQDVIKQL